MSPNKFRKSDTRLVVDCALGFVASAVVTLLVCLITPARPIPDYCCAKMQLLDAGIGSLLE
jgi:hypothetical protein